ncbi:hypothetical protein [Vampirovibrio sp.]|uniref:hypothetical protein n=1 Tax=Vampirovibrio sp. TaxID=2717857 RepID=UPI0035941BC2
MPAKKTPKNTQKISSASRLEDLLSETELELAQLEPQIDKLEKQIEKLRQLKLAKQKLITLKLSIKSILVNFSEDKVSALGLNALHSDVTLNAHSLGATERGLDTASFANQSGFMYRPHQPVRLPGTFLPDMAFSQVGEVLRRKNSLNYELFRAIVFNGGQANTDQIKQYLLDHDIRQPSSGESFEHVELTDISSRVNYLVRKGLVNPDGRGNFVSCLGWLVQTEDATEPLEV